MDKAFKQRRIVNWLLLGFLYASIYMARYNLNVAKGPLGKAPFSLTGDQIDIIFMAGFWTYAASVLFNGSIADVFGGRRAILIGMFGVTVMNLIIGLLFLSGFGTGIVMMLSVLYAVNCYFQSFGALSVTKVNAQWFPVSERGFYGGFFGAMISIGYFLALTVGGWILAGFTKWFGIKIGMAALFLIPSLVVAFMWAIAYKRLRAQPSEDGFANIETGDASSGDETPVKKMDVLKMAFKNSVVRRLMVAEFFTGMVRNGLLVNFGVYFGAVFSEKHGGTIFSVVSTGITVAGIVGAISCGWMSDKLFQSRRAPVACIFFVGMTIALFLLGSATDKWQAVLYFDLAVMFVFGVHGMFTGAASMDFGGKKAAATVTGLLDGIQYVGSGIVLPIITRSLNHHGWDGTGSKAPVDGHIWTNILIPCAIIGAVIAYTLRNEKPKGKPVH